MLPPRYPKIRAHKVHEEAVPRKGATGVRGGSRFSEDGLKVLRVAAYPEGHRPHSHDSRKTAPLWPVKRRSRPWALQRPLLRARKRGTLINLWFQTVPLPYPLVRGRTARHGPLMGFRTPFRGRRAMLSSKGEKEPRLSPGLWKTITSLRRFRLIYKRFIYYKTIGNHVVKSLLLFCITCHCITNSDG